MSLTRSLGGPPAGGRALGSKNSGTRPRLYRITSAIAAGSGSISADFEGYADVYLWGAGASGAGNTGGPGGGGGAGIYRRIRVLKGQSLAYTIGAGGAGSAAAGSNGGNSTLRYPDGLSVTAGGGLASGAGGTPITNGDAVGSAGGAGGVSSASDGSAGADGGGSGGGAAGLGEGAGGGGPAGFGSYVTGLTLGVGGTKGGAVATRGGGGNANVSTTSGTGADGAIAIYWYRLD